MYYRSYQGELLVPDVLNHRVPQLQYPVFHQHQHLFPYFIYLPIALFADALHIYALRVVLLPHHEADDLVQFRVHVLL